MVDFTILWTNYHRQNLHIRHQIPSCGVAWNGHFCLAGAGFLFNLPLRTWKKMSRNETIKFRGQIIQNRGTRSGDHGGGQEHRTIEICWSSAGYQFVIDFLSPPWLESWGSDGFLMMSTLNVDCYPRWKSLFQQNSEHIQVKFQEMTMIQNPATGMVP